MAVTDFHSHILPQLDDGSESCACSLAMLRMEAEQGIARVIATPHFYPSRDSLERFLQRRARAFDRLREETARDPSLPQVLLGAEVHFFHGMSRSDGLFHLTIDEKNGILIEMPPPPWTREMYRELEEIQTVQGLTPILAHIDRYLRPPYTREILQNVRELPLLVQANASFFLRRATLPMALRMLRSEQIHLLGSDCHDTTSRKPDLGPALERINAKLGADCLKRIERYEAHLLSTAQTERIDHL